MRPPVPISIFWMCAFIALLFYGIVTLLPPRTKTLEGREKKSFKRAEAIISIALSISGLTLLALAFMLHNEMAKSIYSSFVKITLVVGLLIVIVELIMKMNSKKQ